MSSFVLPPFGVPTTAEIKPFWDKLLGKNKISKHFKSTDPRLLKLSQIALLALRALDCYTPYNRVTALVQIVAAAVAFNENKRSDAFVLAARAIASLMGYGRYFVFADIAVTYMTQKDIFLPSEFIRNLRKKEADEASKGPIVLVDPTIVVEAPAVPPARG